MGLCRYGRFLGTQRAVPLCPHARATPGAANPEAANDTADALPQPAWRAGYSDAIVAVACDGAAIGEVVVD